MPRSSVLILVAFFATVPASGMDRMPDESSARAHQVVLSSDAATAEANPSQPQRDHGRPAVGHYPTLSASAARGHSIHQAMAVDRAWQTPVPAGLFCERSSAWKRRRAQSEPFGAEDKGAEDNVPSIPEPMIFDLVRGLGAHQGELEVNVLGEFPLSANSDPAPPGFDPFGLTPSSEDQDGIEWAPEIEYAVCDGFALEFELPYENSTLEAYKFAAQLTFGTALDNRFIDGTQIIVEPDTSREVWDLTFLYLAGMQFDETWSALGMIGVRPEVEEGTGVQHTDGIFNLTVFADINHSTTVALESNLTFGESERTSLLLIPQIDREITDHIEIQAGAGVGFSDEGTEPLAAVRLIYSR